jgi:paraquat-inducible protein B
MTEGAGPGGGAREAVVSQKRGFSIVWLIPLVAAAIGAYLAYDAFASSGPTITITFQTAEGLTAGKTKVEFKAVDAGTVNSVHVSEDLDHVVVTCSMVKETGHILTEGARFWVVRPRVGAGGITGLGTLVSGAYIAMSPGPPDGKRARKFKGLEAPPIAPEDAPGLKIVLHAEALGGVDVGSPILFRQEQVGQVEGHRLAEDGKSVQLDLYIDEEHKQLVTTSSRFWNASGISANLGLKGFHVHTESLQALLAGGVGFATPDRPGSPVKAGSVFELQPEPNEKWLAWRPLLWRGPPEKRPKEAAQPEQHEGLIGRFFHHEDKEAEEAAADHDASQPRPAESKKHGFLHGLFHRGD